MGCFTKNHDKKKKEGVVKKVIRKIKGGHKNSRSSVIKRFNEQQCNDKHLRRSAKGKASSKSLFDEEVSRKRLPANSRECKPRKKETKRARASTAKCHSEPRQSKSVERRGKCEPPKQRQAKRQACETPHKHQSHHHHHHEHKHKQSKTPSKKYVSKSRTCSKPEKPKQQKSEPRKHHPCSCRQPRREHEHHCHMYKAKPEPKKRHTVKVRDQVKKERRHEQHEQRRHRHEPAACGSKKPATSNRRLSTTHCEPKKQRAQRQFKSKSPACATKKSQAKPRHRSVCSEPKKQRKVEYHHEPCAPTKIATTTCETSKATVTTVRKQPVARPSCELKTSRKTPQIKRKEPSCYTPKPKEPTEACSSRTEPVAIVPCPTQCDEEKEKERRVGGCS